MVRLFWKPSAAEGGRRGDVDGKVNGLTWYKDLGGYSHGEFSMAVIQANGVLEDQSQLECGQLSLTSSGPFGTFLGVYDGHGGPETSRFITGNLFRNIKRFASEQEAISTNVIKKAFMATDQDFLSLVKKQWQDKPQLASVGSCCLAGIVTNGSIYIGNAGDSRVVLGRLERATKRVTPIQLSEEHNANLRSVREELWSKHPNDPHIVSSRHNVWRVKGLIQVSRSIGDAYLKRAEFNREPLPSKFLLSESFSKPILSSEPSVSVHKLQPEDQFLIFASDGLWEHLTNQEAVEIVQNHQRKGVARRLIKAALEEAARKREMRYSDLQKIDKGVRRHFHDDITVIVLFLDQLNASSSPFSVKGP